jgi:hypothetical protein
MAPQATASKPRNRASNGNSNNGNRKAPPPQQIVQTWAFDSVGTRKYALQIRKASNGNPCLKIVEGVPQGDGTFRRFELTFWSEDFPRLFETLDQVRKYMAEHNIKTPDGHKYDPNKKFKPRSGPRGEKPGRSYAQRTPASAPAASV